MISACRDNSLKLWNLLNYKLHKSVKAHNGSVSCLLKISPDTLASGSALGDNDIKIWWIPELRCRKVLLGHTASINGLTKID